MNVVKSHPEGNGHPEPDPVLVSETTAARLCGVSQAVFRRWVDQGRLSPVDVGVRRNLYSVADIRAFADGLPRA